MVQITLVDLSAFGIRLPESRVSIVAAQPYLGDGILTSQEPYQVVPQAKQQQLEVVKATVDVAREEKANFTIIPEYGVPGLEGIAVLEEDLRSETWPAGALLIAGIDGLTKQEYRSVVAADRTCVDAVNRDDAVQDDEWVNCSITWVKSSDETLFRWVQPKLWPALPEQATQHQRMFRGRSMFLFRGRRRNDEVFTFGTMICFDWIAPTTPTPVQRFLEEAHRLASESQLPITWMFVIQHNKKPSHGQFLKRVVDFFEDRSHPNATRNDTCLIFANTAGRGEPGSCETHGTSGLVFGPRAPFQRQGGLPTLAHDGSKFRSPNEGILATVGCGDLVLRERGECIHAFEQINPSWVQPGAAGRSYAAEKVVVHPARGKRHLLAPGRGVAAAVKWVNDQLDDIRATVPDHDAELAGELVSTEAELVEALRQCKSKELDEVVRLATPGSSENPDEWSDFEGAGLNHVVRSLQIAAMGTTLMSVGADRVHGVVRWKGQCIDVVAVRGLTHRKCVDHLIERYGRRQRRHLLLVSRDEDNTLSDRRQQSILGGRSATPGPERRYIDGRRPSYHVGYQDMIGILGSAKTSDDVAAKLYV